MDEHDLTETIPHMQRGGTITIRSLCLTYPRPDGTRVGYTVSVPVDATEAELDLARWMARVELRRVFGV